MLFPTRFRCSLLTFGEDEGKNAFGIGGAKCHSGGRGAQVEGPRNGHHKILDRDPPTVHHGKTCIELVIKAVKENGRILCEFI